MIGLDKLWDDVRDAARKDIFWYIECFYNRQPRRIEADIGMRVPKYLANVRLQ